MANSTHGPLVMIAGVFFLLSTQFVRADTLTLFSDSSSFPANDTVNWTTVGPPGTFLGYQFSTTSDGGVGVDAATSFSGPPLPPYDQLVVEKECSAPSTFPCAWGGFQTGDPLLFTGQSTGPLTLSFSQGIFGAGLELQANTEAPYTVTIQAFDGSGSLLGTFSMPGTWSRVPGSAMFLGIEDTSGADISSVTFSISGPYAENGFLVNDPALVTTTPEPATCLMSVSAVVVLLSLKRRIAAGATGPIDNRPAGCQPAPQDGRAFAREPSPAARESRKRQSS